MPGNYCCVGDFARAAIFSAHCDTLCVSVPTLFTTLSSTAGLSNLSAMAGRIDFILGVAGHYTISTVVKAMFECDL